MLVFVWYMIVDALLGDDSLAHSLAHSLTCLTYVPWRIFFCRPLSYTSPSLAPLILSGGLRMSTQGQGDGGVYFSTLSPVSYGLGSQSTAEYEENLIVDCFGKERLEEYRGKHKLDLVLVYGIDPAVLQQAPGGRSNAKMVGASDCQRGRG